MEQARAFGRRLPWTALVPFADCLNHANVATKYDFDVEGNEMFRLFPSGSNRYCGMIGGRYPVNVFFCCIWYNVFLNMNTALTIWVCYYLLSDMWSYLSTGTRKVRKYLTPMVEGRMTICCWITALRCWTTNGMRCGQRRGDLVDVDVDSGYFELSINQY